MEADSEQERFLALLRPLRRELEIYARRMTADGGLAEDALQNAVLRAFRRFDRYRPDASFRAWMYQIVTNEVRSLNRSRRRIEGTEVPADPEWLGDEADTAAPWEYAECDEEAIFEALDDRVVDALRGLTANERAVLLQRAVGDLKYREIAEALGIPLGSVMGHLARARSKARQALARGNSPRRSR